MINARRLAATPLVIGLVAVLSGCAAPPTKDELAALDYGVCPRNHEAVIKEKFRDGFLTRYADELVIWPPQKMWFRAPPLEGSQLYAGYLVPVLADQTFGPQPSAGKQLHGFMFKNDTLIKQIHPIQMQNLTIKEAVGPFPKDERNWQQGHSGGGSGQTILEYVLPGETVQNWSELVSVQLFSNIRLNVTVEKFVAGIAEHHKSRKPGCAIVSQKILASTPTEVLYEQTLAQCAPLRDEFSIRKAIRGPRALTEVSYSKTTALSDAEKKKWAGIVGQATMLNECQRKP